jgi:hypothetical protein
MSSAWARAAMQCAARSASFALTGSSAATLAMAASEIDGS